MFYIIVTPLDVVKVRLQAQRKPFKPGSCFVYSNGLTDFLCVCSGCSPADAAAASAASRQVGGLGPRSRGLIETAWYERPGHFSGMTVK